MFLFYMQFTSHLSQMDDWAGLQIQTSFKGSSPHPIKLKIKPFFFPPLHEQLAIKL